MTIILARFVYSLFSLNESSTKYTYTCLDLQETSLTACKHIEFDMFREAVARLDVAVVCLSAIMCGHGTITGGKIVCVGFNVFEKSQCIQSPW